jgi:hypothetical protein
LPTMRLRRDLETPEDSSTRPGRSAARNPTQKAATGSASTFDVDIMICPMIGTNSSLTKRRLKTRPHFQNCQESPKAHHSSFSKKVDPGGAKRETDPMKGKRSRQEFQEDAVRHGIKSGPSADEGARGLAVTTWSLPRWKGGGAQGGGWQGGTWGGEAARQDGGGAAAAAQGTVGDAGADGDSEKGRPFFGQEGQRRSS